MSYPNEAAGDEKAFFQAIQNHARETGEIGDVFPSMVEWNVPRFLLKNLWPEQLATAPQLAITDLPFFAFAASETDWNQKIHNIRSKAQRTEDGSFKLEIDKAYVMQCRKVLALLRYPDKDSFCLAILPMSMEDPTPGISMIERDEPHTVFRSSSGTTVKHYRMRGAVMLPADSIHPFSARGYSVVGVQIHGRELTGLALLANALADHHDFAGLADKRNFFRETQSMLLEARDGRRLKKETLRTAAQIVTAFAESPCAVHPLWQVVREFSTSVASNR